ncbi:MAG TPA: T9SS type A sorting domain-containing protein, partial [Phnomibacter sp.]|nr:T9SS type A sorting domain-containing protein [Phnomibacter sp.]
QVYKINPQTRVTTYLGKVAGIDASFTINGAAVDEKGQVLLASSTQPKLLYVIADMNRLEATPEKNDNWLNASDLASSNLLFSNKPATNWDLPPVRTPGTDAVSVFPNPVDKGFFIVAFDNLPLGRYSIDLLNGAGSAALTQNVQVREKGQTVRVNTASFAKGLYVMRIIDADRKQVHTQKVILQ